MAHHIIDKDQRALLGPYLLAWRVGYVLAMPPVGGSVHVSTHRIDTEDLQVAFGAPDRVFAN